MSQLSQASPYRYPVSSAPTERAPCPKASIWGDCRLAALAMSARRPRPESPMKTKPFLLATAGSTVDGRMIDDKMLEEMASRAGGKLKLKFIDPQPFSEEEDEATLRRYHLDIVAPRASLGSVDFGPADGLYNSTNVHNHTNKNSNNNDNNNSTIPYCNNGLDHWRYNELVRHYWNVGRQRWRDLRQAARQRRAARLLSMPSESMRHRCQAGLVSWCCDATDAGIALTAAWLTLWGVGGWMTGLGITYWLAGVLLLVVRVTARRCCCEGRGSVVAAAVLTRATARRRRRLGSRSFRALDGSHSEEDDPAVADTHHHQQHDNNNDDDDNNNPVSNNDGGLNNWIKDSSRSSNLSTPPIKEKNSNRDLSMVV